MWTENHKFAVKKQMLPVTKRNEKSPASGLDADYGKGTYDKIGRASCRERV